MLPLPTPVPLPLIGRRHCRPCCISKESASQILTLIGILCSIDFAQVWGHFNTQVNILGFYVVSKMFLHFTFFFNFEIFESFPLGFILLNCLTLCFVSEVPHKCVSTGSARKLCQSPLMCQPREDGKARPESILFTSTHRETEHITQPLWHAVTKLYLGAQDLLLYLQVYLSNQSSKN